MLKNSPLQPGSLHKCFTANIHEGIFQCPLQDKPCKVRFHSYKHCPRKEEQVTQSIEKSGIQLLHPEAHKKPIPAVWRYEERSQRCQQIEFYNPKLAITSQSYKVLSVSLPHLAPHLH